MKSLLWRKSTITTRDCIHLRSRRESFKRSTRRDLLSPRNAKVTSALPFSARRRAAFFYPAAMKISHLTSFPRFTLVAVGIAFVAAMSPLARAATVTVNVGMNGFMFSPNSVTIHPGDTVHWVWKGGGHSVTSGVPQSPTPDFNSGIQNSGFTFDHTFN